MAYIYDDQPGTQKAADWIDALDDATVQMYLTQIYGQTPSGDSVADRTALRTVDNFYKSQGIDMVQQFRDSYAPITPETQPTPQTTMDELGWYAGDQFIVGLSYTDEMGNIQQRLPGGEIITVGRASELGWYDGETFTPGQRWVDPATGDTYQRTKGGAPIIVAKNTKYGPVQYDENGQEFQYDANNVKQYTGGQAPTGAATNAPTGWAGWGQQYSQGNPRYDPTTGTMIQDWNKTPMGAADTLAQAQWANQAGNWYDTALLQRQQEGAYTGNRAGTPGSTIAPSSAVAPQSPYAASSYGPGISTFVPDLVGRMVGNKQGYAQNYDLQGGQNAMGVTPSGYYQDYNQGYTNGVANPGGGYQTYTPSMQAYGNWNQTNRDEMGGWLNTGFSGYGQPEDYWGEMYKRAAPRGGGTRLSYR